MLASLESRRICTMNFPGRAVLLLPLALLVSPAGAAPAVIAPVVAQPAAAEAPAPAAPSAVSSSIVITLGATGDFDRKTVNYGCEGDVDHLAVDYINAAPNYLSLLPLDGSTLLFNTVLAASGAKYAAGKYVWWNKGTEASLYDLTQGPNAKPVLTCSELNETP
jgi:membrane-bound inhibitor of C-type lysozyme